MAKGDASDPYTVGSGGDYANWAALLAAAGTVAKKHIKLLETITYSASNLRTTGLSGIAGTPTIIDLNGFGFVLENTRMFEVHTGGAEYVTIKNGSITGAHSTIAFISVNSTGVVFDNITFRGTHATPYAIALYGTGNLAFENLTIQNCTFSCAALVHQVTTAGASGHIDGLTFTNNVVSGAVSNAIELRFVATTDNSSYLSNITVSDNTFTNCTGFTSTLYIRDQKAAVVGTGIKVYGNTISGAAGAMTIGGFTATAWGANAIHDNIITDVDGDAGGINVFTSAYLDIFGNQLDDIANASSIDGNGILVDDGCDYVKVRRNYINNVYRNVGTNNNTGCGVMVLASTNVEIYGNKCNDCRIGLWFGGAGAGQSATVYNNDFTDCTDYGLYLLSTSAPGSVTMKNNRFTGAGYSIYDGTAVDWSAEDYNSFSGFASGAHQHTLGANSKTDGTYLGLGTWLAGVRAYDDLPLPLTPDIGAVQDRNAAGRRFGAGGGTL